MTDTHPGYCEEQRFRQPWLWVGLVLLELVMVVLFAYGMVRQLVVGLPWGNQPTSDAALAIVGGLVILQAVGLPWFIFALKLTTEVKPDGLYVRFFPFPHRRIAFDDIRRCEARTYRPLLEYGGWGIRWSPKGKAYNVSGNRGVQLELTDGRRLLIGSQRADDLARAIQAEMRR